MTNRTAEIVDMKDARARRRGDGRYDAESYHAGARLASAREAQGLTLREAAAKTHIGERRLAAIEELNRAGLPARPYAIGFVRTYADFLELDAAEIVERFKEDIGYETAAPVDVEKFAAADTAAENEKKDMSLAAIIAVIAFMVWCTWQITRPHEITQLSGEANSAGAITSAAPVAPKPEDVVAARVLERIEPVYPIHCALDAQAAETVVVVFNLTGAGRVSGARVAQASNDCFADAALNAMRRWRFEPQKIDGEAQPAYDQRISFTFNRPQ